MIYHYNNILLLIEQARVDNNLTDLRKGTGKNKNKTKQTSLTKKRHNNKTMEQTGLAVSNKLKQLDDELIYTWCTC